MVQRRAEGANPGKIIQKIIDGEPISSYEPDAAEVRVLEVEASPQVESFWLSKPNTGESAGAGDRALGIGSAKAGAESDFNEKEEIVAHFATSAEWDRPCADEPRGGNGLSARFQTSMSYVSCP